MITPIIALLGVDGAGKSSTASEIKKILNAKGFHCKIIYMGRGRDRALPGARDTMKKLGMNPPGKDDILSRDSWITKNLIFMRDMSYLLDAFFRYIKFILPAGRRNKLVITDRYAYDIVLNKKTVFITKLILRYWYPTPQLTFFLYNKAEILFKRKKQHNVAELEWQMNELRKILNWKFKGKDNYWEIKTNSVNETVEFIFSKMQLILK